MKIYQCKRCGYETKNKYDFTKHLNRKYVCNPLLADISVDALLEELVGGTTKEHTCQYCGGGYATSRSKWRHEKTCGQKEPSEGRIALLEKELQELRGQLNKTCIQNNGTINNNSVTINIDKRNFAGGENTSYLDNETLVECFRDKDLITILSQLHFNPEHPENHNVRIKSLRHNLMEYVEEGCWKVGKKDYVLHHLVFNGWRVLEEFHKDKQDEVEDICSDDEVHESLLWLDKIYKEDQSLMKRLKDDAFILMLNNKALLLQKVPEDT